MKKRSCKMCISLFECICWTTTTTVIFYWIYKFSLNEDLCIVDYKKYDQSKSDVFPVLSLCFKDPFSSKKLSMTSAGINETSYLKFLEGTYFIPEMLDIDYKNITIDISDNLVAHWAQFRNGSYEEIYHVNNYRKLFFPTYAGFWGGGFPGFYNCYGMQMPPDKEIQNFGVLLKNNIFPSSMRPSSHDFFTLLHYPTQLLISTKSIKYAWPTRITNNTYSMRFKVILMEVIRRRNKGNFPCNEDWENIDDSILVKHTSDVGCKAPYQDPSKMIRRCYTSDEMKKARFTLRTNGYGALPPCKEMEKILYTYEEVDLSSTEWKGRDQFWISIFFRDQHFKEIVQTR